MIRELDVVPGVWTHSIAGGVLEETFHQLEAGKIAS